jgi:hypothetical protein
LTLVFDPDEVSRAGFRRKRLFKFISGRKGFISPARRTAYLTGSAVSDDSQFFANATCIYPNLPENFAPPILID